MACWSIIYIIDRYYYNNWCHIAAYFVTKYDVEHNGPGWAFYKQCAVGWYMHVLCVLDLAIPGLFVYSCIVLRPTGSACLHIFTYFRCNLKATREADFSSLLFYIASSFCLLTSWRELSFMLLVSSISDYDNSTDHIHWFVIIILFILRTTRILVPNLPSLLLTRLQVVDHTVYKLDK